MTGDLITRPVSRQGRVQSIPVKKISIKLGKQKTSEKVQEAKVGDLFKDVDPNEQTELVPVTVDMKQGNTNAMRASTVIKNLNDTVQFVERQQKYAMSLQMTITTLRDSNNALISMYQDEKVKTANFDKLVQGVKELREFFKAEARAKEQILVLNKEVADTDLKASTVTQWIKELKDTFVNESTVLSKDNAL